MFDKNLMKLEGVKPILGALVIFGLVQAAAVCAQAYTLSAALAALWSGDTLASQAPRIVGFLASFSILHLVRFCQDTMLDNFADRTAQSLREKLLAPVFDPNRMLAEKVGAASVTVAATEGIDEIQAYVRVIPPKLVGVATVSLPVLAYTYAVDVPSGIILTIAFPVIVFFMVLLGRQAKARAERQYETYTQLSNNFLDTLRGIEAIESLGAGKAEGDRIFRKSEQLRHATVKTLTTATLSSGVLDLIATFGVAAVSIMLAFRLMDASLALGPAICALILAPEFLAPVRAFASDFHASLDGKNALSATLAILDAGEAAEDERPLSDEASSDPTCAIVFENVSYSYGGSPVQALSNVNVTVREGERVAVIGKSGAGKSTFALLASGLMKPTNGRVSFPGGPAPQGQQLTPEQPGPAAGWVAACAAAHSVLPETRTAEGKHPAAGPGGRSRASVDTHSRGCVRHIPQHPHIFQATLEDNIRLYAPESSRADVARACELVGLDSLVRELPEGLDTVVGEGGRGLSGGQAHRVALARILLDRDARILVFDEPTAHLDIETEWDLKANLLRVLEGKTVIFATHRLHWLEDVDRVIVLDGGTVTEVRPGGEQRLDSRSPGSDGLWPPVAAVQEGGHAAALRGDPAKAPLPGKPAAEDVSRKELGDTLVGALARRYLRHILVALALGAVAAGCTALLMFAAGYLVSETARPETTLFAILVPVAFIQLIGLGKPVARYLERLVSHDWVFKVTSDLRAALFKAVRVRAGDPAQAKSTGEYLAILDDDIAHLQDLYLRTAFPCVIAYVVIVVALFVFGAFSLPFALLVAALFLLCGLAMPLATHALTARASKDAKAKRAREYASLADDIGGARDWIFASRTGEVLAGHAAVGAGLASLGAGVRRRVRAFELLSSLALGLGACLVLVWASTRFAMAGASFSWTVAFTLGYIPLIAQIAALPESYATATEHVEAVARLDDVVAGGAGPRQTARACGDSPAPFDEAAAPEDAERPPEGSAATQLPDRGGNRPPVAQGEKGAHKPSKRATGRPGAVSLSLVDVAYTYPSAGRPALDGVSLNIPPGQKVAVLGRSGAGKSTLARIIAGPLVPSGGRVLLDGEDTACMPCGVARNVGVLSQSPYLFNRTLRENLAMGNPSADDETLAQALRDVGLGQKLSSLPQGLDTVIGETGVGVSGGEAHRVALARMLVAGSPILLIDEPFSALDPETERNLLDTLLAVTEDRTLIVITHHLEHIEQFDRVMFVEDGRIALDGNPVALSRENERFKRLLAFDRAHA